MSLTGVAVDVALLKRGKGGGDREKGDDAHLGVLDSDEGVGDVVRGLGQAEGAEGGHTEGESALLQGDQYSAADTGQVCGDVGEHAAEEAGEQHRLSAVQGVGMQAVLDGEGEEAEGGTGHVDAGRVDKDAKPLVETSLLVENPSTSGFIILSGQLPR